MKIKIYFYPGSRVSTIYDQAGYYNCIPFSPEGITKWIEPTMDPDEARLFYCGQFHDKESWRLKWGAFEFLEGRESKHIFDIEGDWRGKEVPEWLRPCILTAMNASASKRDWNVMVRPGCSQLLIHLARNSESGFRLPTDRKIWFTGQRDSSGLRERILRILSDNISSAQFSFSFNTFWSAHLDISNISVLQYRERMGMHPFILCPAGEGQATLRVYEACAFGRIPVVIADALMVWEDLTDVSFMVRMSPASSDGEIAAQLAALFDMADSEVEDRCRMAALYFEHVVKRYFDDPTEFTLTWMRRRGLL